MGKSLAYYHVFPFHRVNKGDSVVIFGMGEVGQSYVEQLGKTNYCNIRMLVDKNNEKINSKYEVQPVDKVKNIKNTSIVIANGNVDVARQIRQQLLSWGIEEKNILWDDLICENYVVVKGGDGAMGNKGVNDNALRVLQSRVDKLEESFRKSGNKMLSEYNKIVDYYVMGSSLTENKKIDEIKELLLNAREPIIDRREGSLKKHYTILDIIFQGRIKPFTEMLEKDAFDLACIWGSKPTYEKTKLLALAKKRHVPIILFEDGFIESITHAATKDTDKVYRVPHSLTADVSGAFFMGGASTAIERVLNSERELTSSEFSRARKLIKLICDNKISKYNNQPIKKISVGTPGRDKILVIDQVYNDQSISDGMADDSIFVKMLACAVKENPDADILIKTHPVSSLADSPYHFADVHESDNIHKIDEPINPIAMLQYVDKVYVCSSQMGFEALMCGKEVHVFGMPFYAGWGVTHDRQICPRRTKLRSVEEIFYLFYVEYTLYVSYRTHSICEIEDVIQEILMLRSIYEMNKNMESNDVK